MYVYEYDAEAPIVFACARSNLKIPFNRDSRCKPVEVEPLSALSLIVTSHGLHFAIIYHSHCSILNFLHPTVPNGLQQSFQP